MATAKVTASAKGRALDTAKGKKGAAINGAGAVVAAKVMQKVVTARTQRMQERADQSRAKTEPTRPATVSAMKLTALDSMGYSPEEFAQMLAMYDGTFHDIKEGEIVSGKILAVSHDSVIVDVGFKSEGVIPLHEFASAGNIIVGSMVDVFLEAVEDANGQLQLSKQKADFMRVWDRVREAHDAGVLVQGRVVKRIKGGFVVDVMGVDAFLPGSQIALRQVPDFDAMVGGDIDVKIIKLNKARRNIVVSRRAVLEEQRESQRADLLREIGSGQVRKGFVKNITDFGVFIDLGGVDGLLHITDMSWGRIRHPSEICSLGQEIEVKILDYDDKTQRISLGLKQLSAYPWENIEAKYPIGLKSKGRVVSITDYGAFVELEEGIEGLIHISEMSWTQHIKHPSKIMNVGDKIDVVILSVDRESEKISLGIKQLEEDPWKKIDDKFPVGSELTGKVRNLTAFGAFVELEEGIDGLVHISDMSWTKRVQHPSEVMKKGDTVKVRVLKIDHDNRRISLGYKQLQTDPWPELALKYAVAAECLGAITRVLDRGLVVELDGQVEGFVPTAHLGKKDIGPPQNLFIEGQQIPLTVIEFDSENRRITLSIEAYFKSRDAEELEAFFAKQQAAREAAGVIPVPATPAKASKKQSHTPVVLETDSAATPVAVSSEAPAEAPAEAPVVAPAEEETL